MKRKLSFRHISLFPKLILIFLLVIAPLFGLSLALNELGRQEVQSRLSDAMLERMQYEVRSLERELLRIVEAQQQFVNDNDLLDLSSQSMILSDYQRTKAINRLQEKMFNLQESSPYIQQASLYIAAEDRIIATGGLPDRDAAKSDIKEAASETYKSGYPVTNWNNRLFLLLLSPLRPTEEEFLRKPPRFILSMELSRPAVTAMLERITEDGMAELSGQSAEWRIHSGRVPAAYGISDLGGRDREHGSDEREWPIRIAADEQTYLLFQTRSLALDTVLTVYMPENVMLGKLKSYRIWFWMLVGCSLIIVILFSYGIYLTVQRPLGALLRLFRNVEQGQLNRIVLPDRQDEFGRLFAQFDEMIARLKQSIDELYVQKIRLQQAELRQLQAQIAPHFLYNSFFVLHQLIKSYENEQAERISAHLGHYFQYITRNSKEEAMLSEEVSHVCAYAEIQSCRFSNRIACDLAPLPGKYANLKVPRLILQPLVENVYEHAFDHVLEGGLLTMRFMEMTDRLCVIVGDNGQGMTSADLEQLSKRMRGGGDEEELTGLVNVHRRLQIKFGEAYGLTLHSSEGGGTLATVNIPLEFRQEDREKLRKED